MPEPRTFQDFIDYRYGDRGGYKVLNAIFAADLPYKVKLDNASKTYRVSTDQVGRWYRKWKGLTNA